MKNVDYNKIHTSNYGERFKIIEYNDFYNVKLQYDFGLIVTTNMVNIRNGCPPNPLRRSTCGVGYSGIGDFKVSENGVKTAAYLKWQAMLNRIYSKSTAESWVRAVKCYSDVSVCDDWLNFQNFAKWYYEESTRITSFDPQLDKDILSKGLNLYSPETCSLVPRKINMVCQIGNGVFFDKSRNKWQAKLQKTSDEKCRVVHLGRFENKQDAINAYCKAKDLYVIEIMQEFKNELNPMIISALENFNTYERLTLTSSEKRAKILVPTT